MLRDYETIVIFEPEISEEDLQAQLDRIYGIIDNGGEVQSKQEWGIRTLAYTIAKKYKEGYYVLIYFAGTPEVLDNLEHYYKINDKIIRSMITKKFEPLNKKHRDKK